MKTLYLVRHAKSSWDYPQLIDKDRPLSLRGNKNAEAMSKYLKKRISCPEIFVCSTSQRTRETIAYFENAFKVDESQTIYKDELYHAYPRDFEYVISQIDNIKESAMLFSHNPGITDYVNQLTHQYIDNIPTCGVAAIDLDIDHWNEIVGARGELLFHYYPKGIKK